MTLYSHSGGAISLVQHPGFRPRPNLFWRARETRYARVNPFPTLAVNPDHCLEQSRNDFRKLEWFSNIKKAELNQRVSIYAEEYLTRFFPDLSAEDRALNLTEFTPCSYRITQTPEEVTKVYDCSVRTCIRNHSAYHGTERAYSADIRVAYLPSFGARTVVWPAKKIFGRLYGPESSHLKWALLLDGYTEAYPQKPHMWSGAQLFKEDREPPYWDQGNIIDLQTFTVI